MIIFSIHLSYGATIVVLQGDVSSFGRKYFSGFSSVVRETVKAYQYTEDKAQFIFEEISKSKPDIIFTIGVLPILKLSNLLPLTTFIVGDYNEPALEKKPNIVLTTPDVPVENAVDHFLETVPAVKSIGTMYDPRYSQTDFNRLTMHLNKRGIQMVSIKIDRPEDAGTFTKAFGGKIQALVLLKDPTLSHEKATLSLFDTVRQFKWPVLSLNPGHSDYGALLTESVDPIELGEQAWEITQMILKDKRIPLISRQVFPKEMQLTLSLKALQDQKLTINDVSLFIQKRVLEDYQLRFVK